MLSRLLYLRPGELGRLFPFFLVYFLLSTAFTLADGLSQSLFVQVVGPANLPRVYALVAVGNLVVMALYLRLAERGGSVPSFHAILGLCVLIYAVSWVFLKVLQANGVWYGVLYAAREIGFTLVLMHFGNFLNDWFTRDELDRVLPMVYSGGRVGGMAGGFLLQRLAEPLGLLNLLWVFNGMCLAGMVLIGWVAWRYPPLDHGDEHVGDPGLKPLRDGAAADAEHRARTTFGGFLRFVWASPLLFWLTVTMAVFIFCRWILNYQYNAFFAGYFADDVAMAEFLGLYTQIALAGSLVIQLFVVSRLIAWIGLKGAHFLYGLLLAGAAFLNLGEMTLAAAVFARLVESELRFGLRNPVQQLITNKFSKSLRVRIRAWSFGTVIPLATLVSSALLGVLSKDQAGSWIAWWGALFSGIYLLTSLGLAGSFTENRARSEKDAETVGVLPVGNGTGPGGSE